jgi:uncharacterized protein with HEPN domain
MNSDKNRQILDKIARHIRHTLDYCRDISYDEFSSNRMLQEACIFNVLQVGELAASVPLHHPSLSYRAQI